VKSILPGALARKIRPPIFGRVSAASNSLVVWFEADVDPSHSGKALGPGSRYECTLLNAEGKRLAAGSLNEIVDTSLYGDGRRLLYAVFPASTNASLTLCIQERVVNSDGTITYQHPPPVGAGLSGANLTTNGMVRFAVSNRGG